MTLRIVTFGDLDAEVWGFVWDGPGQLAAIVRAGRASAIDSPQLEGDSEDAPWTLAAGGLEILPESAPAQLGNGFEQLCRVRGPELDCLGRRAVLSDGPAFDALDSVRDVSAWFAPGDGVALTALRPGGAKGHDADLLTANVFDEGAALAVADPRLSTTYTATGDPRRVSLELWLDDEEAQYPQRVVGTATGPGYRASTAGFEFRAEPLRCLRRGQPGTGVFIVVQNR